MTDQETKLENAREKLITQLETQLKSEQAKLDSFITENEHLKQSNEALLEMHKLVERRAANWQYRFETLERETRKMREQVKSYYETVIAEARTSQ